jgi:hypothetical protein
VLREHGAAVGNAGVGDQDVEIVPDRPGEFRLRIHQVHDSQVRGQSRDQPVERRARDLALLRQRPDAFEAIAEVRRSGADGGRLHQGMAGGAGLAAPG